jgi:hypothetical protein
MDFIPVPPAIRRSNLSTLWTLADRWFRLLEFVLVLGLFYVAKEKTHNVVIAVIYWLSYVVFLMWFEEFGEFVAATLGAGSRSPVRRGIIWGLAMLAALGVYAVITQVGNAILTASR